MRALCLVLIPTLSAAAFAAEPAAVIAARKQWNEVERERKAKDLVEHRIALNATDRTYAVVGNYGETATFFVVQDELHGDHVVRVDYSAVVAVPKANAEYLFDSKGRPVFARLRDVAESDLRFYFDRSGKLVRLQVGEEANDAPGEAQRKAAEKVRKQAVQLMELGKRLLHGLTTGALESEDVDALTSEDE